VRETTDERTGERTFSTPIGSYDFCPTPDKSVSVAWAFAPPVEQAQIYNAHIESAREAVAFLAQHVGMARYGKGGQGGSEPGHVSWLEFTHHTARKVIISGDKVEDKQLPGDPDLHTHFLMQNAVFCASGRVGSLDTAALKGSFSRQMPSITPDWATSFGMLGSRLHWTSAPAPLVCQLFLTTSGP
jgi:hypothetical protein